MSPAYPRHAKTVRVSQRFFISPAASVRIENLTAVGKTERAEKRPHVAVIEIGIDPETVQPRIEAKLLRQELLECAQISADLDVRMGEIKNRIVNKENT